jgi:surface protein
MKKTSILLILLLFLCIDAFSQKVAYAVLKNSTLTFYYDDKKPEGAYDVEKMVKVQIEYDEDYFGKEWKDYFVKEWETSITKQQVGDEQTVVFVKDNDTVKISVLAESVCHQIKTAVFDKSFKKYRPKSCTCWFKDCENLTSIIGIKENLNTSEVTDMWEMFRGCKNLTSLDVSGFNTENVTDMNHMFDGCENLKSIYVGDGWNTSNVTYSEDMFENCPNLVGGQGIKYDEDHKDVEYAHIDGGESNPGYLTKKTK